MSTSDPLWVTAVLAGLIVAAEWLVRRTALRHLGTALLVILLGALAANLGLIPSASEGSALYDGVFTYVAPLTIFWLLLEVNLKAVRAAGVPMLVMFLLGAAGTTVGVLVAITAVGMDAFGALTAPLAGMFTGTYTGGSINFNAIGLHYRVVEEGAIYAGAVAVDNLLTAIWMIVTLALPAVLQKLAPRPRVAAPGPERPEYDELRHHHDTETVSPLDLGVNLAMGAGALWFSDIAAGWLAGVGLPLPSILILTTIALLLAQHPRFAALAGARVLGIFGVYFFLVVIGAHAEVAALTALGQLGVTLLAFVVTAVLIHGLVVFGAGWLLKQDWEVVAIASQANIGGGTSALALARSFDRPELFLPAILAGSVGTAGGTYLGFFVAGLLGAPA
ncbi:MAG: DUF819 family protein [Gammaproteobacteria bacterium]